MSPKSLRTLVCMAASLGVLCQCGCMPGQRVLQIEVEVDGVPKFQGMRAVRDSMSVESMWSELEFVSLKAVNAEGDSLSASENLRLTGEVVVRILHVENELSTSQSNVLDLESTNGKDWCFAPGEIQKIRPSF